MIPVHEAWQSFEPVAVTGQATGFQVPINQAVVDAYLSELDSFVNREISEQAEELVQRIVKGGVRNI